MKRIISIVITMVMVFSLVGCSTRKETEALEQEIAELKEQIEQLTDYSNIASEQLEQQKELNELLTKKLDNLMGVPIVYTEEEPFIKDDVELNKELYVEFTNFLANRPYNAFEEFYTYYVNEFSDKIDGEFFMLDPNDGYNGQTLTEFYSKKYSIYVDEIDEDGVLVNPILHQYVCVRDEVLGSKPLDDDVEGFYDNTSFRMYMYIVPSAYSGTVRLEFGYRGDASNAYINLYIRGICIGTVYYYNHVYISQTWFENYFHGKLTANVYCGSTDMSKK